MQSFNSEPDSSDIPLISLKLLTVETLSSSASILSWDVSNTNKCGCVRCKLSDDDDKLSCKSLVSVFGDVKLFDGVDRYPIAFTS